MPYLNKKKQSKYQSDRVQRLRSEWFAANGPCVDCGSWDKLEVDHVDPSTKVSHRIWSWSKKRREEELAKCEVRCRGCHMKKSATEALRGGEVSWGKLKEEDVLFIRSSPLSGVELARQFNVDKTTISNIRLRKTWKHI